jgi:hypothetical protein
LLYNNKSLTKTAVEKKELKIDFREILCPNTLLSLNSSNCSKCQYCKITKSRHRSGRILSTLVCLYGSEKERDKK